MTLYSVTTVMKQCRGCKDVAFHWFLTPLQRKQRPYAELIAVRKPR
jgi:hypothetical protein